MSKSLGHALEGYIKGLVQNLCDEASKGKRIQYEVRRKLPVALSMNCDVVVWRKAGKQEQVIANILVFHSLRKDNSHMKWKRSRQEYVESELFTRRLTLTQREKVHKDYHTGMVVFLPFWKDELIADFRRNLTPFLFAPDILPSGVEAKLCEDVEKLYDSLGCDTEAFAAAIRKTPGLIKDSNKLQVQLKGMIFDYKRKSHSAVVEQEWLRMGSAQKATVIPSAISSRFCHGFNLLALFSPDERTLLYKLHGQGSAVNPGLLQSAEQTVILKAIFLNVISLRAAGKGGNYRLIFRAKEKVDDLDVAFLLDRLKLAKVEEILGSLMGYATKYGKPYAGFVSGLRMANCKDLLPLAKGFFVTLKAFLKGAKDDADILRLLRDECQVATQKDLWTGAAEPVFGVWTTAVSLCVATTGDRSHTKVHEFDRDVPPTAQESKDLLRTIKAVPRSAMEREVAACLAWIKAWESADWKFLAENPVPPTFNIGTPSSWLQWHYNIVGTHSVFSAVSEVCFREVVLKEANEADVDGFPKKRSAMVSKVVPGSDSRAQLAMVATIGEKIVFFEGKCVTANHIGDKSKELYDRVGDFKRACHAAGVEGEAVLVIDGDFSDDAIKELASPEAYDRIYSMEELLPKKSS